MMIVGVNGIMAGVAVARWDLLYNLYTISNNFINRPQDVGLRLAEDLVPLLRPGVRDPQEEGIVHLLVDPLREKKMRLALALHHPDASVRHLVQFHVHPLLEGDVLLLTALRLRDVSVTGIAHRHADVECRVLLFALQAVREHHLPEVLGKDDEVPVRHESGGGATLGLAHLAAKAPTEIV